MTLTLSTLPGWADNSGSGGAGGADRFGAVPGGSAGTGTNGAAGGSGRTDGNGASSGGGGGSAGGGAGGAAGGTGGVAGGTTPGADGTSTNTLSGGGGGAGGANGTGTFGSNVGGQKGGNGGNTIATVGGGGGGGAGGFGLINPASGVNPGGATISGGNGGDGGSANAGNGGNGGNGGVGILASGITITNQGTISGGAGGAGGFSSFSTQVPPFASSSGSGGNGGDAIVGSNLTIINSGTINGGAAGAKDGAGGANGAPGYAIYFTGGTNTLELDPGSQINGAIGNNGGINTLVLGGSGSATFDANQLPGIFSNFIKNGSSTWTLINGISNPSLPFAALATPWTINQGTLSISTIGALGDYLGQTTLNGGTLSVTSALTLGDPLFFDVNGGTLDAQAAVVSNGVISGSGTLTVTGPGSWQIAGTTNSFSGNIVINGGNLVLGDGATSSGGMGSGTITLNSGTLGLNPPAGGVTFANNIGGSGAVNIVANSATLSGNNSYSGQTGFSSSSAVLLAGSATALSPHSTIFFNNGGTLDLNGYSNTVGALLNFSGGVVTNNGAGAATLTIGGNGTSTLFSGTIQNGTGVLALTKTGPSIQTLSGSNSYNGLTTINAGTLQAGAAGGFSPNSAWLINANGTADLNGFNQSVPDLNGSGNVTSGSGQAAILTLTGSGNDSFSGTLSGTGLELNKTGAGTLTLSSNNSYDGPTTIANGTLALAGAGAIASSSSVAVNAIFDISGTTSGASINALSGSGTVELGSKALSINLGTGASTFGGAVHDGGLSGGTGGSLTINGSGGVLTFAAAQAYTGPTTITSGATLRMGSAGSIASSSSVLVNGIFDISQTNAGGSSIQSLAGNGTVQLGAGAGAKSLTISTATDTFAGSIKGDGSIIIAGGTENFTGNNNYTGGTVINPSATLLLGSGGTIGSTITDNGLFGYNGSGSVTLATMGNLSGTGGFAVSGGGTLIIDTTASLTGTSNVSNGTLQVGDAANPGASLAGGVNVGSGGLLEGHGTVNGAVTVANGGTLRPGGSIGTLTVKGNVALPAGTTFTEEFSSSAASTLAATGTLTLGGALQLVPDSTNYAANTDYKFITGSSVSGAFNSVSGAPSGYTATIQYSANGVDMILNPSTSSSSSSGTSGSTGSTGSSGTAGAATSGVTSTFSFNTYGNTPNQIAAGTAFANASSSAPLYAALGKVVAVGIDSTRAALGSLSGEIHASLATATVEDDRLVRTTLIEHLDQDRPAQQITIWGVPFAGRQELESDGNAAELDSSAAGIIGGADIMALPDLRLGVEGAFVSNHFAVPDRTSDAHGTTSHGGLYASWNPGNWDLKLGGDIGSGTTTVIRNVTFASETDSSTQSQQMTQFFGDLGYRFKLGLNLIEPYLDIAHLQVKTGSFAEGSALSGLSGNADTNDDTFSVLGVRFAAGGFKRDDGWHLRPFADLGWQHAFNAFQPLQTESMISTGTGFTVEGLKLDRDALVTGVGMDLRFAGKGDLSLSYNGLISSRSESNTVKLQFAWAL